jgi:hypothetical protein
LGKNKFCWFPPLFIQKKQGKKTRKLNTIPYNNKKDKKNQVFIVDSFISISIGTFCHKGKI